MAADKINPLWTARLSPSGPAYAQLAPIFHGEEVPLVSCQPVLRDGPSGPMRFYQVDVSRLTPAQRTAAVALISRQWNIPQEEVEADFCGEHGWPLRIENISIAYSLRAFL